MTLILSKWFTGPVVFLMARIRISLTMPFISFPSPTLIHLGSPTVCLGTSPSASWIAG